MRRSEIEQDIVFRKWRWQLLLCRLCLCPLLRPPSHRRCLHISFGHLISLFPPTHAQVHITLSFLIGLPFFRSNYFFYLSVYIAVLGGDSEIAYRTVYGKLAAQG